MSKEIAMALSKSGWFSNRGAYVLLDGQYGSTGKGLVAAMLAKMADSGHINLPNHVTTNAGPNSGHTSYFGPNKLVLQQIPTFSAHLWGYKHWHHPTYLNAGAVIDPRILDQDILRICEASIGVGSIRIHPMAAVIDDEAHEEDASRAHNIGSTGKGVGAAIARKVERVGGKVARDTLELSAFLSSPFSAPDFSSTTVIETAQGFDLSLNGQFYPYCTSRECTVMQALSDARVHPQDFRDCLMVLRTFPIRVAGNSGGCWPDQQEIS